MAKRQSILIVVAIIVVLLFSLVWFFKYLHRTLSQTDVLSKVNATYDKFYTPVNAYFQDHELSLAPNPKQHPNDKQGGCVQDFVDEGQDQRRAPTTCLKMDSIRPIQFDDSFKSRWVQVAPGLEQFLQNEGWHKEYADQTAAADLFNHSKNSASFLNYNRDGGNIHCQINFDFNPPYPNPADQMWIKEDCREVL